MEQINSSEDPNESQQTQSQLSGSHPTLLGIEQAQKSLYHQMTLHLSKSKVLYVSYLSSTIVLKNIHAIFRPYCWFSKLDDNELRLGL